MTVVAVCSAGGAPGVTTTALGLAFTWPRQVLTAEMDLAGGAVLPGNLRGQMPADRGLLYWAVDARRGPQAAAVGLWNQVISLDQERQCLLLPGLSDPLQAANLDDVWPTLATTVTEMPLDVVADLGRVGPDLPLPMVGAADVVAMMVRPTLRQLAAAGPRVAALRPVVGDAGALVLLLVGNGPYGEREVARQLQAPVAAHLPEDPRAARVLSDGAEPRSGFRVSALMRGLAGAGEELRRRSQRSPRPATGARWPDPRAATEEVAR